MYHDGSASIPSSMEAVHHGRPADPLSVFCRDATPVIPELESDEAAALGARLGMMATLDLLCQAAILTDSAGIVMHANDASRRMNGDGLCLAHGRLRASTRLADAAFQALILRAASMPCAFDMVGSVSLPRWPARPLIVHVAALGPATFGAARTLVLLNRLDAPADPTGGPLPDAFGLTCAETRLVRQLAGGRGLARAAAELGVSISTVRTHLKAVFAKTETHSQAELASLFARGAPFDRR